MLSPGPTTAFPLLPDRALRLALWAAVALLTAAEGAAQTAAVPSDALKVITLREQGDLFRQVNEGFVRAAPPGTRLIEGDRSQPFWPAVSPMDSPNEDLYLYDLSLRFEDRRKSAPTYLLDRWFVPEARVQNETLRLTPRVEALPLWDEFIKDVNRDRIELGYTAWVDGSPVGSGKAAVDGEGLRLGLSAAPPRVDTVASVTVVWRGQGLALTESTFEIREPPPEDTDVGSAAVGAPPSLSSASWLPWLALALVTMGVGWLIGRRSHRSTAQVGEPPPPADGNRRDPPSEPESDPPPEAHGGRPPDETPPDVPSLAVREQVDALRAESAARAAHVSALQERLAGLLDTLEGEQAMATPPDALPAAVAASIAEAVAAWNEVAAESPAVVPLRGDEEPAVMLRRWSEQLKDASTRGFLLARKPIVDRGRIADAVGLTDEALIQWSRVALTEEAGPVSQRLAKRLLDALSRPSNPPSLDDLADVIVSTWTADDHEHVERLLDGTGWSVTNRTPMLAGVPRAELTKTERRAVDAAGRDTPLVLRPHVSFRRPESNEAPKTWPGRRYDPEL